MDLFLDLLFVFAFILVGGVFAATELALVSLRDSQIDGLEDKSKRGKEVAQVARDPNRFLSAAQIGVTFVGFLSASYGATELAPYLQPHFLKLGLSPAVATTLSVVVLTLIVSYLSLVFGELVPKRLAMQRTEGIALAVAPILDVFAKIMRPVIWLLSKSTNAVFRLLRANPNEFQNEITEEEVQSIIESQKSFEDSERQILSDVIDIAGRSITEVMRSRVDVEFLEGNIRVVDAAKHVSKLPYSRFPVIGDGFDDVLGFVHVRDLLVDDENLLVGDVARNILKFPGTNHLLPSLTKMRDKGAHIAIVLDEYGGTDGILTLEDIIEEMIGDIHDEYDVKTRPELVTSKDGSFSIDGGMTLDDFYDETGIKLLDGPYETVAGFILADLGQIPAVGDVVTVDLLDSLNFSGEDGGSEVAQLIVSKVEGMRISRVKVRRCEKISG
ncbi:MAG: hemolysin family protein [Candidatus Ancillula trichonymphae]|jgi:putative hemolysin|nr:hemolysin family protein [Candidatus Ancillula trichonymphae]